MDIDELVASLTLEEKASLTAGTDLWHTPGVERLGIPPVKVTDGPNGARGARFGGVSSLYFPCATALGATWDPDLVRAVGECIAGEVRDKRAHVLLAPTVNLHRYPLAGRNFECYSEDPYLTARLAVAFIDGVQSQGVGACVKHFVANDQEFERMTISSEVEERVLRELYLLPFETVVREVNPSSVMSAYNRLHGKYCSDNPWLLTDILKDEWGYDGIVMSDWFGTHSTDDAANAGLDLEMPGPAQWLGEKLVAAVENGTVSEDVLDDKVRRLLRWRERVGAYTNVYGDEPEQGVDDPHRRAVVRRAAASSFVLLRNEQLLPFGDGPDATPVRTLAVIGPNADVAIIGGGGSASVTPLAPVTPLAGIRSRAERASIDVQFERGGVSGSTMPVLEANRLEGGFDITYFVGRERDGEPLLVEQSRRGYFVWLGQFSPQVPDDFSVRVTATVAPDETGEWTFSLVQAGRARLWLDGEVVVDNWQPEGRSEAFFGFGSAEATAKVALDAGSRHELAVEFVPAAPSLGGLQIGCLPPHPDDAEERAVALAQRADAVVLVVGTDPSWETEGHDRESMRLPGTQERLVERVTDANARTAIVLNAASPIEMDWAERAAAVMQVWFPGEELGAALADVLFGDVSPSGRLPTTIPFRLEDAPSASYYPGRDGKVEYGEGLLMGYRGHDARGPEPRYPFGFGLSYTTFEYGEPRVSTREFHDGDGPLVEITVPVTNRGARAAAEVVQCYVADVDATVERPPQELKAFAKLALEAGETGEARLALDRRAFAFWSTPASDWIVEPGPFELRIGSSSRDIHHVVTVECV
jgi:beta-glucosidase